MEQTATIPSGEIHRRDHDTLAARAMTRLRLQTWQLALVIGGATHLAALLAVTADGELANADSWTFWRGRTLSGTVIAYLLLVYPFVTRLRDAALESLRPMSRVSSAEFDRLKEQVVHTRPVVEVATILLWVAIGLWSDTPWRDFPGGTWQTVWDYPATILLWGLAGATVYHAIHGTVAVERMHQRAKLRVGMFADGEFAEVTRWSLGVSAVTLIGVSVAVIFVPPENLTRVEIYAPIAAFVVLGVALFFVNLHVVSGAIGKAKAEAMAGVRAKMSVAADRLRSADGQESAEREARVELADWLAYERRLKDVPVWPIATGTFFKLGGSAAMPGVAFLVKYVLNRFM